MLKTKLQTQVNETFQDIYKKYQQDQERDDMDDDEDIGKEFADIQAQMHDDDDQFNAMLVDMMKDIKKGGDRNDTLRFSQINNTMQLNEKVQNAVRKNPYLKYGSGIQNYFVL